MIKDDLFCTSTIMPTRQACMTKSGMLLPNENSNNRSREININIIVKI